MGFGPPGAPLKNPATARKAEKKKRREGARTLAHGIAPAGNLFDDLCACLQHEAVYNRGLKKGQGAAKEKAECRRLRQSAPVASAATCSYNGNMTQIPIREAKNKLTELARRVEAGESITVTRNGKPVMELVPAKQKGGINWEGGRAFKKERGITNFFGDIPVDFDDPLPEDILITPLPPPLDT